ncbi:hypothetical protein ACFW9O_17825 [Streptomyces sp. NPDC059499]|uniref:hypothetical protein n=1 Tax=Streptomyces sp. NPDC059499 TaxID=3346852 RepID=UPI003693C624
MTTRKTTDSPTWDAYWAEVSGARTEVIRGVEVDVPRDVPFGFEERLQELSSSSAREDVEELVSMLFGPDIFGSWVDAGMGYRELLTVLTWGMAQASGTDMSFAEAFEAVAQQSAAEGKAPSGQNRAARRRPSASTGGQSKRTSGGSTVSRRAASRS